uniref:Uncharacterized protein n=1 Tax=Trypanosoma vivax (strain Y486) TaxID=1055687 RepID=G0U277_TRYVY|nr:hypothetical protein TVY486_0902030 [Trypanosoma vivax Y486]
MHVHVHVRVCVYVCIQPRKFNELLGKIIVIIFSCVRCSCPPFLLTTLVSSRFLVLHAAFPLQLVPAVVIAVFFPWWLRCFHKVMHLTTFPKPSRFAIHRSVCLQVFHILCSDDCVSLRQCLVHFVANVHMLVILFYFLLSSSCSLLVLKSSVVLLSRRRTRQRKV